MSESKSPLDIITKITAKTVSEVSKIYYEDYSDSRKKQPCPNQQKQACPFGTSYEDIIRYTNDIQIFAKHIDTQFRKVAKNNDMSKKEKK